MFQAKTRIVRSFVRLSTFVLLMVVSSSLAGSVLARQHSSTSLEQLQEEAALNSSIMNTAGMLTDVFSPRMTGTPELAKAGRWALDQMSAWGLSNARAEAWNWGHPGWSNLEYSVRVTSPYIDQLHAEVVAWTPSTNGTIVTDVVYVEPPDSPTQQQLSTFLESLGMRVTGRAVMIGPSNPVEFQSFPQRFSDEDAEKRFSSDNEPWTYSPREQQDPPRLSSVEVRRQIDRRLVQVGAALRIGPSSREMGLIRTTAGRTYETDQKPPSIMLRDEDFGRIHRTLERGETVSIETTVVNKRHPDGRTEYNYLAELPGATHPDEVVMLGGHLDAWHTGTGATDNAGSVAVMMEAMRILKATDARPDRTIRIALWTGEEQGLRGSRAYVAKHFGMPEEPGPEYHGFNGYLNLDEGTGRVRGAIVFGTQQTARDLESILAPLDTLGVAGAQTTMSRNPRGSDHAAFNQAGLPGIHLGQDPIRYYMHTWHSNVDTYERLFENDLRQAAVVVAWSALQLADDDNTLTRIPPNEMPAFVPRD